MAKINFIENCQTLIAAFHSLEESNIRAKLSEIIESPRSARVKKLGYSSIELEWTKVADTDETLVAVRKKGEENLEKLLISQSNAIEIVGLAINQQYQVELYSVRSEERNEYILSQTPLGITLSTNYVINGELPPFLLGSPCPFGDCSNPVSLVNNCFDWAAGTAYYRIEIVRNTNSEVVARNYLKKSVNGDGTLRIQYCAGTNPCSGVDLAPVLNGATGEGCAEPAADRICGAFPNGENRSLAYSLIFSSTGCCVQILSNMFANDYFVRVNLCQEGGM